MKLPPRKACRSRRQTRAPRRAAASAAPSPAGPPPATHTSTSATTSASRTGTANRSGTAETYCHWARLLDVPATIETEDLTRAFGSERALEGVTFRVEPGEVVALLGPNGAGKTTTIRLLNGILRPDRGRIRVLGIDPSVDGDAVRRRTGVLSEGSGLDERLTALENVTFAARIRGIERGAAERTAADLLARFGMSGRAGHAVRGFSTGQRKRVALARALLHDPEVLFLDEPTSGLDPEATRDVLDLLATMAREHGRTVVVCTHFLAE
ncbi:MAG: ABC transporter ATP-binding protein, partial [Actinobacteria bacterium]